LFRFALMQNDARGLKPVGLAPLILSGWMAVPAAALDVKVPTIHVTPPTIHVTPPTIHVAPPAPQLRATTPTSNNSVLNSSKGSQQNNVSGVPAAVNYEGNNTAAS